MKGNTRQGIQFVDYPKDLPHISEESVICAARFQDLVRDFEKKYDVKEYNSRTHLGCWRIFLYKESKQTMEILISAIITAGILTEEQLDELKLALLAKFQEGSQCEVNDYKVVSISIIESVNLSGGYDYSDKISYLTERENYTDILNGFKFSVSPLAFFQVNSHVFEKILNQVKDWAELDERTVLLDICCGTGVIGIALSNYVKKIIGIEIVQVAVDDCVKNCELNDIEVGDDKKCEYFAGKAEDVLSNSLKEDSPTLNLNKLGGQKIVAIVDPPRSGLHHVVLRALRTCKGLDKIVYVSCNANSLAENLYALSMFENKKRRAPEFRPVKF